MRQRFRTQTSNPPPFSHLLRERRECILHSSRACSNLAASRRREAEQTTASARLNRTAARRAHNICGCVCVVGACGLSSTRVTFHAGHGRHTEPCDAAMAGVVNVNETSGLSPRSGFLRALPLHNQASNGARVAVSGAPIQS